MTTDQRVIQNMLGMAKETEQSIGIGYSFDVEEVIEGGEARVKVIYHGVSFKQDAGMLGTFEYDSADPPEEIPPMARGYSSLVDESFYIWISPIGRVREVEGADEIVDRMIQEMDIPEGMMKAALVEKMQDQFGDDGIREMMNTMFAIYPEGSVRLGDSWSNQTVEVRGYPVFLENTFTLVDRKNGVATIDVNSVVKEFPDEEPMDMGEMTMSYSLSGSQKGKVLVDEQSGWAISAVLTQVYTGEIYVDSQLGGPMGDKLEIPIDIENIITLESFEEQTP